ncbi:hypothetical protein FOCG_01546 [Fusarium oxysporum f. sp. radicis-lycopersici 26381]|uniref:Uncharacterized protein n=2 Tax=Fusarium oxysporum TaxID=5507 RepID=W9IXU9_FUSOX|nr:hypothetical protein FOYG_03751 [Fusarium oxysporum NRRL 32931]EWZ45828.1 hypothetical protein FOZG_06040 [Fusarium oxysporum Fo47]EWZ97353.1 hypothetical protein FOWG_01840 [Fusarium oxysporum f. sp. lycopersici MN25]EXL63180.1 hypothetical protein FOCG_01546 [Fusarium oxysporum f. sp. radicis-lycopersici 26381]
MASGYDYILIYKPASADELIRAIEVAKSLQMAFVLARRVELSQ